MEHLALSAIGRDRPGIVAAVTRVLLDHGVNIEDSQMTILRGHFTMTLILGVPRRGRPRGAASGTSTRSPPGSGSRRSRCGASTACSGDQPEPSHIVTVYGSDHPGIVCATAEALARHGYNITDLNTRLVGDAEGDPLYALMLEVADPGRTRRGARAAR